MASRRLGILKNPHYTPAQEAQIEVAEQKSTRATIYELGAAEFLKTHMPCTGEIAVARDVLQDAIDLRAESQAIHDKLRTRPVRPRRNYPASAKYKKSA